MSPGSIPVILLAAGGSTRSKKPKQLLLYKGKPLLRHTVEIALESRCRPVHVVLGARARRLIRHVNGLSVVVTVNDDWKEGISSSIRAGLRAALEADENLEGALFIALDQPLVTSEILDRLVEVYRETHPPIAVCAYEDTLGIPALFDRSLFSSLEDLKGDQGAKQIILHYQERAVVIDCPAAGFDIDSEEDLQRLTKN